MAEFIETDLGNDPESKKIELDSKLLKLEDDLDISDKEGFGYEVKYLDKLKNGQPDPEGSFVYKAQYMGETLSTRLQSPDELLDMLALIDDVIKLYKEGEFNYENGDRVIVRTSTVNGVDQDIFADNVAGGLIDQLTTFKKVLLNQEKLEETLGSDNSRGDVTDTIKDLDIFFNKVIQKIA